MAKRYRYIGGGGIMATEPISNFRLIGGNQLRQLGCRFADVIRVAIPDDMKLEKHTCDRYSTTDDKRTLEELNYDIVVRINGKMVVRNDLKPENPTKTIVSKIRKTIMEDEGYYCTDDGYLDVQHYEEIKKYEEHKRCICEKDAEELKDRIDNHGYRVSDLECVETDVLLKTIEMYANERRVTVMKGDKINT